ncbi:MAG: hypothetical protein IPM74_19825, partial [Crocinitomicaceae bacterium]|nr:hypothetical protein [Crocinitomicaceae bacterium]
PKKEHITYKNSHGITFDLDLKEYQMKQIYLYDIYEKNTVRHIFKLIQKLKKRDLVVFDVGANIGFYSSTFPRNSTEPLRDILLNLIQHTYAILEKNITQMEVIMQN